MLFLRAVFYRFRSRPRCEELCRILAEGPGSARWLRAMGQCGAVAVDRPKESLLEYSVTRPSRRSSRIALTFSRCSLHDFGQTVEASSVLHAIGDRGPSRDGSIVRFGFWNSWVHRILVDRSFSIRDFSEQKGLGALTPTIQQTNLSQRPRGMPLRRTFGLAGLTQMQPVHVSKPGVTSCWPVHKKPFPIALFRGWRLRLLSARKMLQNGSDPKRWFAEWAKELSIRRKDRAWHEMHTLMDIFYQVGCYVQLNMGALACMELVSRRLQQFSDAHAHGADALLWACAKHFSGSSSSLALVLSREEAEL